MNAFAKSIKTDLMAIKLRGSSLFAIMALSLFCLSPAKSASPGEIYVRPLQGFNESISKVTIQWRSNEREIGKTTIAYGVEAADGKVSVCGMFLHSGEINRRAFAGTMANSGISSGGRKLIVDLRYFREFIAPDQLLLACKATDHMWDPIFAETPAQMDLRGEYIDPEKQ